MFQLAGNRAQHPKHDIEGSQGLEALGDYPQATLFILADWDQNAALWALELGFSYHTKVCASEKSLLREECG